MKIKPDKHFDIKKSVIYATKDIILILKNEEFIKFDNLYQKFRNVNEEGYFKNYIYALYLLFSLGKIQYYKENDIIGLCNYEIE